MSNSTPSTVLHELCKRHNISPQEQLEIILGTPKVDLEGYYRFMNDLNEALCKEPAAPEPPPQRTMTATNGVAEIQTFFDRDLARASLNKLVQLPSDGQIYEKPGYDTARLVVPKDDYEITKELLLGQQSIGDLGKPGDILGGWYTVLSDGSTAAISIVNAETDNGGPYVDAFLIIPTGVHPTVPNPSLQPTRDLDQDFVFPYPDGTFKVAKVVPSTV